MLVGCRVDGPRARFSRPGYLSGRCQVAHPAYRKPHDFDRQLQASGSARVSHAHCGDNRAHIARQLKQRRHNYVTCRFFKTSIPMFEAKSHAYGRPFTIHVSIFYPKTNQYNPFTHQYHQQQRPWSRSPAWSGQPRWRTPQKPGC